jgi:DNA transposition AAA+ family ATPase
VPKAAKALNRMTATLWALLEQGRETLIRRAEKKKDPLTLAERFVTRPEYEEVKDCLEDALANAEEALEERVVILVGGTRAGKTAMIAKLKAERKVNWHLVASPDLRSSYKAFLAGIAKALSLRDIEGSSSSEIQRSIMSKLEKMRGVLAIEELQSFSPKALEFLKGLLNHTQVCLVICMLPGQFRKMTRSTGEDMQQFLGRSVGVVKLEVTPALVATFAPQLWTRCPQAQELQTMLATEAMMGGGMSLLRDVCRDASLLSKSEGLKPHHITDALADFRRKIPAMGQVKGERRVA